MKIQAKSAPLYRGKKRRVVAHWLKTNFTKQYEKEINALIDDLLKYERYIDDSSGVMLMKTRMQAIIIKLLEIRGWNYSAIDDYLTTSSYSGYCVEKCYSQNKLCGLDARESLQFFIEKVKGSNRIGISIGALDYLNLAMWYTYDKYMALVKK